MAKIDQGKEKQKGIFSSIFLTYFILILHGLLIVGFALLVVFFRGVVEYMVWIVAGGIALVLLSGTIFYVRMRRKNRHFKDLLNDPVFRDRPMEISFLGGIASLRVGRPNGAGQPIDVIGSEPLPQLEGPEAQRIRKLESLAHLRESNMISDEEYQHLKRSVLAEVGAPPNDVEIRL